MEKLNTELINKIWLTLSTCTYLFSNAEEENIPIVPENKTHEFLLKNFTINNAILDFYYSHTNRFFSEEEYEKIKKTGYVGRKEHTLKPYPLVIFGAYFNRVDLIIKLQSIIHQDVKERPKLNGNSVEHFSDLIPYFKKYAEGFKNGYENFEQNCINEYLPAFPDKNDHIYKVFEYLTKRIIFEHDWYNNHCGFTISRIVDGKKIDNSGEIVDAYENGQKQGFFYRAWSIVFSNNNLFAPLFEQKTKEALPPQQTEKPKSEPKETELSERIKKHFGFFNRKCPRKHKQILNDTDFEKLIEWTIWYFENEFKVPEISEPIKIVNTNKTFVQLAFKYLFKELHKSSPYPETLFEFYQSAFTPYSEDKKSNFEAVKNNDEVKKLMQIDY